LSLPAAKQNDQVMGVDIHIVMVPSPGGPVPTPLPHPFVGMLDQGLASTVKIEGFAAAMVDSVANAKPPHIPMPPGTAFQKPPANKATVFMGSATVFIEGKPAARMSDMCMTCNDPADMPVGTIISTTATVLIGGPPSKAGSKASGSSAQQSSGQSGKDAKSEAKPEEIKDDVTFKVTDTSGKALEGAEYELLLPTGEKKTGKIGGDGVVEEKELVPGIAALRLKGLHNPRWSGEVGVAGKAMEMFVETARLDDGTSVTFEVYREFEEGKGQSVASVTGKVAKGLATAKWTYDYQARDEGSRARLVFHAKCGEYRVVAPTVVVGDTLEVTVKTTEGKGLASWPVKVIGCDGEEYSTRTDPSGKLKVLGVAFGDARVLVLDGAVIKETS
jgi:uncharacterized Zn-binding protein involved in type VI secretion